MVLCMQSKPKFSKETAFSVNNLVQRVDFILFLYFKVTLCRKKAFILHHNSNK